MMRDGERRLQEGNAGGSRRSNDGAEAQES
jgi:hypothetical protein